MSTINIAGQPANESENMQTRMQSVRDASDCSLWVRRYLEWSDMELNVPCHVTKPMMPITGRPFFDRVFV